MSEQMQMILTVILGIIFLGALTFGGVSCEKRRLETVDTCLKQGNPPLECAEIR